MRNDVLAVIETACKLTRISVGSIRSKREAEELIAWADAVLQVAYASREVELDCDTTELKQLSLNLRYEAKLFLEHKKCSDIVAICNKVAEQLKAVCDATAPDLSIYLESHIKLGTY